MKKSKVWIGIILGLIFLFALVLRITPIVKNPEMTRGGIGPYGDSHLFHRIAYNLLTGNGFSGIDDGRAYGDPPQVEKIPYHPAITRGPVYPFFLSLIYRSFAPPPSFEGGGVAGSTQITKDQWRALWDNVRIVQSVMDALVLFFVFFMIRLIIPETPVPALIGAILCAVNPYSIYFTGAILDSTSSTFFLTFALLMTLLSLVKRKIYFWFFSGGSFGILALARPEYLLFPFLFALVLLWIFRKSLSSDFLRVLVFLLGLTLFLFPWSYRNYRTFHRFIPVSAGGAVGNILVGTFEYLEWDKLPDAMFETREEKIAAEEKLNRYLGHYHTGTIAVEEFDSYFISLAKRQIQKYPLKTLKIWLKHFPRLWYQMQVPRYRDPEPSGIYFLFYFLFALLALKQMKEKRILLIPPFLLFIYLSLIFLPMHVEPRYGVPLMPGILSLTAIGLTLSGRRLFHRKRG